MAIEPLNMVLMVVSKMSKFFGTIERKRGFDCKWKFAWILLYTYLFDSIFSSLCLGLVSMFNPHAKQARTHARTHHGPYCSIAFGAPVERLCASNICRHQFEGPNSLTLRPRVEWDESDFPLFNIYLFTFPSYLWFSSLSPHSRAFFFLSLVHVNWAHKGS